MYRIFKESYPNLIKTVDGVRKKYIDYFDLIDDVEKYNKNKIENSIKYKKLNRLLYYIQAKLREFPRCECLLWELDTIGITVDKENIDNNVLSHEYLEEAAKTINTVMKLNYWY